MIDTILFDLDGTLVDTNETIKISFQEALKKNGFDSDIDHETFLSFLGPSLRDTFLRYTKDEKLVEKMINDYISHYDTIDTIIPTLYPNVVEVLQQLKDMNINMGIVTTKRRTPAIKSLKHFNMDSYFDIVVGQDDVVNLKPHAEPVLKALSKFNFKNAIMIGDNKSDIMSGKNANIQSAGVSWSIKGKDYLSESNPTYMIDNMNELIEMVK